MRAERNTLAKEVYPYLQNYCAQRGLDFQVSDKLMVLFNIMFLLTREFITLTNVIIN